MTVRSGPRERLVSTTIEVVREKGVHGAGLTELLDRSHCARNSLYQHFPGGKDDLVAAAVVAAGEHIDGKLRRYSGSGPMALISRIIDYWRRDLDAGDYLRGCPVAAAALTSADEQVLSVAGAAVQHWQELLTAELVAAGVSLDRAERLSTFSIAAIEGAIIQSRLAKNSTPLQIAGEQLEFLYESALPG